MSRIRDLLSRDIRSGKLSPGARLPTVRDIARDHDVSVATAGRAIQRLEQEGLVKTRAGSGAFVSSRASAQTRLSV
ncbi:MAG TPA: GntR family transcriptional regulator, partial [Candidatus Brocadiia bacterium]|nr:GntR family transcriptional regulator [Candidatus Brocadiia bacterium]